MRNIVLAFNLLSVKYAIIAALGLMVILVGASQIMADVGVSKYASIYMLLPLMCNLVTVYGLTKFKIWSYLLATLQLLTLILNVAYGWLTGGWQDIVGSLVLLYILIALGNMLYLDFKSRPFAL